MEPMTPAHFSSLVAALMFSGASIVACEATDKGTQVPAATAEKAPQAKAGQSERWVKIGKRGSAALADGVKAEVAKAQAKKLTPIVYVGATWCDPCLALKKHRDDPKMVDAFEGTFVIEIDADDWNAASFGALGYKTSVIPIFIAVDAEGKATGRTIDGGAWGDNIPQNMAPPLKQFFSSLKS
jgi:hypothetical protein